MFPAYHYNLDNFLKLYPDADEQEFFMHVWEIIDDVTAELNVKNHYTSRHAMEFRNKQHLKTFLAYLKTTKGPTLLLKSKTTRKPVGTMQLRQAASLRRQSRCLWQE